ncbi:MAG TPA: ribosomal RNA small subunit methyltransferase A [Elusimicrobia bacterium]|nr:ribosomal RNA small subunit methyltransferase A [Elusimicrobiota bacterium]HBT61980.1 ribosomal RNA small subunit methyltransferase A [Elusimicrobiota bacterium]
MGARLDQHFLSDPRARDAIVALARLRPDDRALEIGPGRGMLTKELLSRAREVLAVELDSALAARLPEVLGGPANLRVINADFLELNLSSLEPGPWKVVANLPYAVATPILQRLLGWPAWQQAVLMFQKEVAQRIVAGPGGCDYGLLTLSVAIHAEAELAFEVPRESFSPKPKVASAVVLLRRRPQPLVPAEEQAWFFRVARAAFGQRRKMALGVLSRALGVSRETMAEAFAACSLPLSARAEEISLEGWRGLAQRLAIAAHGT